MHMDHSAGRTASFSVHSVTDRGNLAARGDEGSNGNGNEIHHLTAQVAALQAENRELQAELERLRAERARMSDVQNRLMEALGTNSPERLVHDVRNVLNERELYRALADATM
jgi:predicted RNase H-like nuclease (RuvC/YqgF family)